MSDDDHPDGRQCLAQLSLEHKPIFDAAMRQLAQPISDYTFTNVFVWNAALHLEWTRLHGHLCVFANSTGDLTLLLPPIPLDAQQAAPADLRACLKQCFAVMDDYQRAHGVDPAHSRIEYVSDEMLERINAVAGGELSLSASPMSGDYLYPVAHMIELPGKSLKSKRHGRNQFIRDYPDHRAEILQDHHLPDCLSLLNNWREHADVTHEGQITEDDSHVATALLRRRESLACRRAVESYRSLKLTGLVVYVGEQLAGFTLGESLSPSQTSILFEKTHSDFHGIPQFIFSEFCRRCWADSPEINVGDDWGIPTLRWTKESYRPTRRLSKYMLARPVPMPIIVQNHTETPASSSSPTSGGGGGGGDRVEPQTDASPLQAVITQAASRTPQAATPPRPATLADVPALIAIERECFNEHDAFKRRQIRDLIANAHSFCRVIEIDNQIAGWCVGLIRHHRNHRSGRIYGLAVSSNFRGRGAAKLLVNHVLNLMADQIVRHCYLEVSASNAPAIALYEKLGFRYTRLLPDYYAEGEAGLSMKRDLAAVPA
ncbi:MAG: GNAT family N-acetyltransferase [Phycisphaerales bacterium]